MGAVLLLIFIAVPLIEIGVFIKVGGFLGAWPTIGLVVLTAMIGTWLIRLQGLATLARAQSALERDELPVAEIFDGLCLLLAGALLLTPGFATDTVGFALLLPPVRHAAGQWLWRWLKARGGVDIRFMGARRSDGGADEAIIDGEFREVAPEKDEKDGDTDEEAKDQNLRELTNRRKD